MIWSKISFEKNVVFDPKIGLFAHKLGQNGVHWGVYRVNFGFLRVPDPLGAEIMQNCFEKSLPYFGPKGLGMGQVGFWGPLLALLGPFLTPLGVSVGPNMYILSYWRYQNHLEPNENDLTTPEMSFCTKMHI